ncbi:hypothetical protein K458DRAFT_431296 [Lentithecium fluviatile CBS 122367]|uniref:RanBD1 domain-containing protein n=1 Tax=Lentithecium fluviatile CBS 122367 TaxID=1168545 RepID=A0A6G1J1D4_9PLEO|nr:hypothetical protein K458DRAFT_431296 [Lentithecium fluviatile CBS 122367]
MEAQTAKKDQPPSPSRTDESSESENRPVREKLKETRIDAQATSDPVPSSDQAMNDAPTNGTSGDQSTSGSDSERGRLRRKRSRENFEDDEDAKHPEKKHERHVRKKSREITGPKESDIETTTNSVKPTIPSIGEKDGDEATQPQEPSAIDRQDTPEGELPDKAVGGVASPKNKRTREQAEAGAEAIAAPAPDSKEESAAAAKLEDERTTKRPRDAAGSEAATEVTETKTKIPAGSGFANTSSTSPFAAMSPKPQVSNSTETSTKDLPQTSEKAFQSSGFGGFAKSPSPFAVTGNASPFGAATGNKLSSFASSTATTTSKLSVFGGGIENKSGQSGFGTIAAGPKSAFAGSPFGTTINSTTTSGFGSIGGLSAKPSGFGSGASITGLAKKPATPFGAKEKVEKSDNEDDEDAEDGDGKDEGDAEDDSGRRLSHTLLQSQGPPETGEENEDTVWTGRAKLYTLAGETGKKSWQERGVGSIKLNVTREEPIKARFVLRADGTHRLLLNAAITASIRFGNPEGNKPEDGKLLFAAPTTSGEVESHLLKLKAERAHELWTVVQDLKMDALNG